MLLLVAVEARELAAPIWATFLRRWDLAICFRKFLVAPEAGADVAAKSVHVAGLTSGCRLTLTWRRPPLAVRNSGTPAGKTDDQIPATSSASGCGKTRHGSDIMQTPVSLLYFPYCITNAPPTEPL